MLQKTNRAVPSEQAHSKRIVRSFYEQKVDAPYAPPPASGQYQTNTAGYQASAHYQPSNQLEEDQFARSQFVHFTPLEPQFEDNINKNLIVPNGSIAYLQCKIKHLGDRMVSKASFNWRISNGDGGFSICCQMSGRILRGYLTFDYRSPNVYNVRQLLTQKDLVRPAQ